MNKKLIQSSLSLALFSSISLMAPPKKTFFYGRPVQKDITAKRPNVVMVSESSSNNHQSTPLPPAQDPIMPRKIEKKPVTVHCYLELTGEPFNYKIFPVLSMIPQKALDVLTVGCSKEWVPDDNYPYFCYYIPQQEKAVEILQKTADYVLVNKQNLPALHHEFIAHLTVAHKDPTTYYEYCRKNFNTSAN